MNNPSLRWNVEAKVLEESSDVSRYLSDLTGKYLSGKGALLAETAALVGYLRRGLEYDVFPHLQSRLRKALEPYAEFPGRAHRISHHKRTIEGSKETPFTCHHLILGLC